MDLLKQSTGQAREAFVAMPMQSRVISVMLVAAIVIGLAFLVRGSDSVHQELLFGGRTLSEQELDAIELAFSRAGLSEWKREGRRIEIPAVSKASYLSALEESSSLPITLRSYMKEAIDQTNIFDPTGLRDSRETLAKQQDLSVKISAFPDVQWASVLYSEGERRGLSRARPQSASVLVTPEGNATLSRSRIKDIENLVRGSYAGLTSEDIVVIDTNSPPGSSLADEDDPLLRKQREAEARVEQKVRSILVGFPAKVAVTADIDPTMDVQKTVLSYDPEPTNLLNKTTKIEVTSNRQSVRGIPGAATNAIGNRAASLEVDEPEVSRTKEDARETTGVAGQQYENSRMASLQVKAIRVSVGLPTSYYEKLHVQDFLKKNVDKTAADAAPLTDTDLENLRAKTEKVIQDAVTPLLPEVAVGADRFPLVEVWDYPDFPEPAPAPPQTATLALTWLAESWQTLALIGLAILALLVARSAAKSGAGTSPPEFAEGFGLEIPSPPAQADDTKEEFDRMTITGKSLREELLTLVEGNPEVAANVIRGWVGEAA